MDDTELMDLLITALYEEPGYCDDIAELLQRRNGVFISVEERRKLFRNMIDLGYATEGYEVCGPHPCIELSAKGREMVLEYGNYRSFLNSQKRSTIKREKERTLKNNEIRIKIVHIVITIIISIIAISISLYSILQNERIKEMEELLHKYNIEVPE